jgi:hypothetical protein
VLVPEPRQLSARLKRGIFFSHPVAGFGLVFFLFGFALWLVFASKSDFTSVFLFRSDDPMVAGQLIDKSPSSAMVNKRRIYQYHYRYQLGAARYEGLSFELENGSSAGSPVLVQYAAGNPARSRIAGMRLAPFGMSTALMVAIFPAIGLVMLFFAGTRYRRYLYLVRFGVLTTGKVVRKTATSTRINQKTVYEVYFRYQSADGVEREACISTHLTEKLGDEAREPLVYDAARPGRAVLLDTMPPSIRAQLAGR